MDALRAQFPPADFAVLAVVLALPLLGAIVNGVFGKRLGKEGVRAMALSAVGGSFLASVLTFLMLPEGGRLSWTAWEWLTMAGRGGRNLTIDVKFGVDALTATMMLVVTGIGFLIHLYSTEYMKKDPGFHRFFAYLNLFVFSMLVLIMGDNLAVLFVGWEGVGLCSYLLIGFWFSEEKNAIAGKKAFVVNRIGDFGLLLAMAMLVYYVGALDWNGLSTSAGQLQTPVKIWPIGNLPTEAQWEATRAATSPWPSWLVLALLPESVTTVYASTLVGLALFLGCAGKSAQIPLFTWLPDAMAGPTPVSALIHAATMVTAGVYLVARMSFVFVLSPFAMATVATVGVATALFAASIGLLQTDLKKILAYSTVSQLGFMFVGVGVGAYFAGFFHVFTHAFFKACLFLGAGSVIHAMHVRIHDTDASQDVRKMGGLAQYMPLTRWTFLVSCLSIAGAPLFAGFWSKDEILWKAFSVEIVSNGPKDMWQWPSWLGPAIFAVGVLTATLTSFYMFRAYFLTFHGRFRGWRVVRGWKAPHGHDHHDEPHHGPLEGPKPKESPLAMTLPLIVLGTFAVGAGFLGAELIHVAPLAHKLEYVWKGTVEGVVATREAAKGLEWPMVLPGLGAFLGGTGAAMYVYLNHEGAPERAFEARFPRLYRLVYDKWRIDELYDQTVVGMVDALADIFVMADKWIVDGLIARASAAVVAAAGAVLRLAQTGRVQVYAASMVVGLFGVGWFIVHPRAHVEVNDAQVELSGIVEVSAAPGLGYSYLWEAEGVPKQETFGKAPKVWVRVDPGQTKEVKLRIRSAIGGEAETTVTVSRAAGRGAAASATGGGAPPAGVTPTPPPARGAPAVQQPRIPLPAPGAPR